MSKKVRENILMKKMLIVIFILFNFSACSINPEVTIQYQPRFDFSTITSYSLYPRNSDFSELQNVNSILRNNIELAIEQRLDTLGLRYEQSENADVIVSYYLLSPSRKKFNAYNKSVKYCEHCLNFYQGDAKEKSWQKHPGSLLIDLVETKTHRSVWRSVYPLNIKTKDSSQKVQTRISDVILWMFTENPQHIAGML